jgi:hypothetical protein
MIKQKIQLGTMYVLKYFCNHRVYTAKIFKNFGGSTWYH